MTYRGRTLGSLLSLLAALAIGLAGVLWMLAVTPWPPVALSPRDGPPLASAKVWGYQLQRFNPHLVPEEIDLLVVDYSRDGTERLALAPHHVEMLRNRGNRPKRIVLAYMSIGEAESYRFYWRGHWRLVRPSWLGAENPNWQDNFAVHYWHPEWRAILTTSPNSALSRLTEFLIGRQSSYIDRILEAGFDGVFLDRVDAFYGWRDKRPTAEQEMVDLVIAISDQAKARRPGFLVVAQNGEELLVHQNYRRAIDGVAKEDLFYSVEGPEQRNNDDLIAGSLEYLDHAKADGLPVFVVEYVHDPANRRDAAARAREAGFPILFTTRDLKSFPEPQRKQVE